MKIKIVKAVVFLCLMAVVGNGVVWAAAGDVLWTFETEATGIDENFVDSCPIIGVDGTIYFGSDDYNLYALNPNGTQEWKYTSQGQVESPALGRDGTIYFFSREGSLYAINTDGSLKWKYSIDIFLLPSPSISTIFLLFYNKLDGIPLFENKR